MKDHSKLRHYVYRIFDTDGRLIYVGCTYQPEERLAWHRAHMWWANQIDRIKFKVYPDKATARAAEREAIREENPRWNILTKWDRNRSWTEQDTRDYIKAIENAPTAIVGHRAKRLAQAKKFLTVRFQSNESAA